MPNTHRRHDATGLVVDKFVQTRRNCRQLVANFVHTRRDSTRQLSRVGVGGVYWALHMLGGTNRRGTLLARRA